MPSSSFVVDPAVLPRVTDTRRAALGLERWNDAARAAGDAELGRFAADLAGTMAGRALLEAVFGQSPFLGQLLIREPALLRSFITQAPDAVFDEVAGDLEASAGAETDPGRLMLALRRERNRVALLVALADLTGRWTLEQVTAALTRLADRAIGLAVRHLLRRAAAEGEIALADATVPERRSGLAVIGMGKLGAGELNYSSDIDLILLYDRDRVDYRGRRSLQDCFVRLARDLVRILQERTEAGFVFRTDLRLRPDPGSTPLAMSVIAAETYYEGMGQNWERAAMIKARAVAGDIETGEQFLTNLRPFVWRKHLDFAAIQDIHSIKRQIHAVKGHRDIAVGGHNIKLGRGGIREIEFFAQTQQLIWGGRQPELRLRDTCGAIRALAATGHVASATADEMIAAYRYLRTVEHRLQMVEDRQTQTLPPEGPELDGFAAFMAAPSTAAFRATLLGHLGAVEDRYAELFEEAPSLSGPGSLVFTGAENDPATVTTLAELGFADGASISTVIRAWHTGRYRATRSTRARELLTELMPSLLQALGRTAHPDQAFARFDKFLAGLPSGVQLFSLLYANPTLLELIAEIMGGAPLLADRLSQRPALLEAVLTSDFFRPLPEKPQLAQDFARALEQASDFQDVLDQSRRWVKDRQFQAGLLILRNIVDGERAGGPLSDIAELAIEALGPHVEGEFRRQHGVLPGRGMAIVALGKLGGREMSPTSDLDLIFLYDLPEADEANPPHSDGSKPLAPIHYYARLAQRLINALTVPTGEGKLYEVDMRLRPSGTSGPIASSLASFLRYQMADAWTWEHMALTRARVVAGEPHFAAEIATAIRAILSRRRDPEKLAADVADMRRRIAETHAGKSFWSMKHRRGGLIDIDFILQYLQLRHAADRPEVLMANSAAAIRALADADRLAPEAADALLKALGLMRRVQGLIRLTVGSGLDEASLPDGIQRALARAGGAVDFRRLKQQITRSADAVRRIYDGYFAAYEAAPANPSKGSYR
jgi:[glutamine synthetase] adenylyltransferase / [glutamine synthetase]-adenylyl-L-tyrosine phosphorylase